MALAFLSIHLDERPAAGAKLIEIRQPRLGSKRANQSHYLIRQSVVSPRAIRCKRWFVRVAAYDPRLLKLVDYLPANSLSRVLGILLSILALGKKQDIVDPDAPCCRTRPWITSTDIRQCQ